MDLREYQLQYEEQSDSEAAAAELETLCRTSKEGQLGLPRANRFIASAYKSIKELIQADQDVKTRGKGGKFKAWLRAVPAEVAAVIAIRECITLCTSNVLKGPATVQALGTSIGRLYELEIRIREAMTVNPMYMEKVGRQIKERGTVSRKHINGVYRVAYQRVMKDGFDSKLTNSEALHLGKFGVDACYQAGIIQQVRTTGSKGMMVYYELHPEVSKFLTGYTLQDVRAVINVEAGAMTCVPDPWTNLNDGGYLSVRRKANAPLLSLRNVRKEERARLRDLFTAECLPTIFRVANYLQEQSFSVHLPTLEAIQRVWKSGGGVLGVPTTKQPEKPECPLPNGWVKADGTPEELVQFQRWKRLAAEHYTYLKEWRSKMREVGGFLKTTGKAPGKLWFPVYIDRRGRWYYRGTPNPQGSDLAKAVLHFGEKKALGAKGLFWLKVHIANSFGYDKVRMQARAKWVDDNWESIERALDVPEDHVDVWGTDASWCMYAAAWELREALRSGNPRTYKTGIPIHMDATCSGIQHFAALLKDPESALYVNLADPQDGSPKADIYARVAEVVMQDVAKDKRSKSPDIRSIAEFWDRTGVPRALAKRPVMTYLYGATLLGTIHYVRDYLEKEMPEIAVPDEHSFEYYQYLAKKLFAGIASAVPASAQAMQWLRSVAKDQARGKRMEWRTPSGFPVQHDYQDFEEVRIGIMSCGLSSVMVREYTNGTRPHAMQNAISPNFVHALDATHLTFVADSMREHGYAFVGIHDSFGTHPSDVDAMQRIIREQFVRLYENPNILNDFVTDVGSDKEPPAQGSFDVSQVLDSEYFFS